MDNHDFDLLKEAFKIVNNEEKPTLLHCEVLERFANMFMSCSVKSPGGQIADEVNHHHHTMTCRKKGTNCRFNFPRFPSVKTVLSMPARIMYDEPEEREKALDKSRTVLAKVREVLENEDAMKYLCGPYEEEKSVFFSEMSDLE